MKDVRNNTVGPQIRTKKPREYKLIFLSLIVLVVSMSVSTQHFASAYGYDEILGGSINGIYAPWAILFWLFEWSDTAQSQFIESGSYGIVIFGLYLFGVIIYKMMTAHSAKAMDFLHGSARWADKKDIDKAGLFNNLGVYVGGWVDKSGVLHYLRHFGAEHVLCYAPTRSGKGVGLVIPTLLSWSASTVVTDLKGELWALTSGWRKKYAKNKVIKFEPAAADGSICFNPLEEIRIGTEYEVGDAQNLATLIVDPDGKGLNDHWQKTAQPLLVGCILHLLYRSKNEGVLATLPEVDKMLSDPNRSVYDLYTEMTQYSHYNGKNHPVIGSAGRDQLDRPDEEAGSVLSTTKSYLSLFRDPIVARNVSKSEFRIKDLMNYEDPVSLYIVTQPNDKARLRPLVRIMINMIIRLNADDMKFKDGLPVKSYKHRMLMMLDEFPSLGKLDILQESLAFLAGYGIKCYLICQDINQLKSEKTGYGRDETITSNCHVQNAYPPNRLETAQHLSKLTGTTTVVKEQKTTSGKRSSALLSNVSVTMTETARPLLTEDECLRMPSPKKSGDKITEGGDMIVYIAGYPAIYGKQILYFQDNTFSQRVKVPAPNHSDKLINLDNSPAEPVLLT